MIVAHQGFAGHRGYQSTLRCIHRHVWWPTMNDDVKTFVDGCLLCIKNAQGTKVPRPFGAQITAERPAFRGHPNGFSDDAGIRRR